jgi:hypothetical protein
MVKYAIEYVKNGIYDADEITLNKVAVDAATLNDIIILFLILVSLPGLYARIGGGSVERWIMRINCLINLLVLIKVCIEYISI